MQNLAPIALFVYNRHKHLVSTLASLRANPLANESHLIVFSDGAKAAHDEEAVSDVRKVCKRITGFKSIDIIESQENKGLASSIKHGVTEVVGAYGKIIVVEDDLLTAPQFLTFMNKSLVQFQHEQSVMQVSGFREPVNAVHHDNFFFHLPTTWGWGTWKDAWAHYNDNASDLLSQLKRRQLLDEFDLGRTNVFLSQLSLNAAGLLNTWGIKWAASIMVRSGCIFYPKVSLISNKGFDNSGCNCSPNQSYSSQHLQDVPIEISPAEAITLDKEYGPLVRDMLLSHMYGDSVVKAFLLNNIKHYIYRYPALVRRLKGTSWK